jgi:hypothetical protein
MSDKFKAVESGELFFFHARPNREFCTDGQPWREWAYGGGNTNFWGPMF